MPPEPLPMMPTFEPIGSCNRFCGQCCSLAHWAQYYPQVAETLLQQPPFIGMNEYGECLHLRWDQGKAVCSIYDTRPEICRVFPNHPLSIATLPSCTIRFVARPSTGAGTGESAGAATGGSDTVEAAAGPRSETGH